MLLDGTEGQQMLDNMDVNERGQVLLQEDPGNQDYLAQIWRYSPKADKLTEVAHHDSAPVRAGRGRTSSRRTRSPPGSSTRRTSLGNGWYLLDVQAHYTIPGELVEGGQYLALHVPYGKYPA